MDDPGSASDFADFHDDYRKSHETLSKIFSAQQKYLGEVNGQVEEIYSGHNVVKAFNKEEDVIREFEKTNEKLYTTGWRSQFFSGMMMPIMQFVGNLGYVMVALLGWFLGN